MCAKNPVFANKSFVLRGGRMSDAQKRMYDALKEHLCIPYAPEPVDFAALFRNSNPVVCEIGFGMGSATAALAQAHPDINYVGIEVYKAGVGKLLWEIERAALCNIRIIEHDAVEVFRDMISDKTLAGIHIFFPDPWPKKRHHKRRLVQRPFTDLLTNKLHPGAYLYMVTDWRGYAEEAQAELNATEGLANPYAGFAPPLNWRPETKFERKGRAKNHSIFELYYTNNLPQVQV
ncbi:MAG: tRNA (guanosine(46)-N7)-methyltransferase TrmB [Spirochaetaceae bacterium]|jgi:tRNA (guanine-N7-)-methyltransferase|nr:tRNA (guanosine(46)-N7)-methyltransferase TrmB [Spirochaetaceae bacterium]